MRAMVLTAIGHPLVLQEWTTPQAGGGQVRVRVEACGVCRTDLHVVDGELPLVAPPLIPGHEIVGIVEQVGAGVTMPRLGDRVGVPWLGHACGACRYCREGAENLCDAPQFTGYTRPGGFATHVVAEAEFCIPLPASADPMAMAPLLCAGLIGWRCLGKAGHAEVIGLYGFGAAAHIITQVAVAQGRRVFAFTRPGDTATQAFARALGAHWAGDSVESPPVPLDSAILFAPDGTLVPRALQAVRKGGSVVCGGIHMSDIPAFPYHLLWGERQVLSVANLTRRDAHDFLEAAQAGRIATTTARYPLEAANDALATLRAGRIHGAAVLCC